MSSKAEQGFHKDKDGNLSRKGWHQLWAMEMKSGRENVRKFHERGSKVIKQFIDDRDGKNSSKSKLNLFSSDVITQRSMMYGQTPRSTVGRRHADATDDVARVAAEMLQRLLNTDIERDDDGYSSALNYALDDYLKPGLGVARLRYVAEFQEVPSEDEAGELQLDEEGEPVPMEEKTFEDVETDYIHWRDVVWSPARVFHELRWVGFRTHLSREELVERFGEDIGKVIPVGKKSKTENTDALSADPWSRAEVWEIWSKDHKKVFWFCDGHPTVLDVQDDPLQLDGFWPFPEFMVANPTTDSLMPTPDYVLHQDQYEEIDELSTRIKLLIDAVRVAGVYDKASTELKTLLSDSGNKLYPVDRWAAFAEKGGIRGQIDWLPLDQIVAAIIQLRDYRKEAIDLLRQANGMSDIMRGQATGGPATTATADSLKAKFGSVRMQSKQDLFAKFASGTLSIKAQIIARHFDVKTIIERSNVLNTADRDFAQSAAALIKERFSEYRIEVKPEAISLTDFAALKAEKMEVLTGIASAMQAMLPIAAQSPAATPMVLELLQWAVSGLRGASTMEGIFDRAITAAQQAAKAPQAAPQPDPKVVALQMKGQQDMAKIDKELEADLVRTQAEVGAEEAKQKSQAEWNHREKVAEASIPKPVHAAGGSSGPARGEGPR